MKKKLALGVGIIFCIGILVFSFIYSNSPQNDPSLNEQQIKKLISEQYPGKITKLVLKTDSNQPIYEALVVNKETAYNIKLDGHSGDVLDITKKTVAIKDTKKKQKKQEEKVPVIPDNKKALEDPIDKEPEVEQKQKEEIQPEKKEEISEDKNEVAKEKDKPQVEKKTEPTKPVEEKKTVLSTAEVSKIALQHFSGEIDDIELEDENGRLIYEVEIERDEEDAEIKIDAYTGEVIVIEIEED